MPGILPSYEVLSQRNVTIFTGGDIVLFIHVVKNDMSSVVKRAAEFYIP